MRPLAQAQRLRLGAGPHACKSRPRAPRQRADVLARQHEELPVRVAWVTAANDWGVYDLRAGDKGSNVRNKGRDGYTPLGPRLIDAQKIDPAALRVRTWHNGEIVQNDTTTAMVFPLNLPPKCAPIFSIIIRFWFSLTASTARSTRGSMPAATRSTASAPPPGDPGAADGPPLGIEHLAGQASRRPQLDVQRLFRRRFDTRQAGQNVARLVH